LLLDLINGEKESRKESSNEIMITIVHVFIV